MGCSQSAKVGDEQSPSQIRSLDLSKPDEEGMSPTRLTPIKDSKNVKKLKPKHRLRNLLLSKGSFRKEKNTETPGSEDKSIPVKS